MKIRAILTVFVLALVLAPLTGVAAKDNPEKQQIEDFKEKMKSADEAGRVKLIEEFAKSGNPGAAKAIAGFLGNRSTAVKIAAINAVGVLKDRKYLGRLMGMVKKSDKEPTVMAALMLALGEFGDKKTKKILIDTAKKWLAKDSKVSSAAAMGLGKIKDRETVDELIKLLAATNPTAPAGKSISQKTYDLLAESRPAIVKGLQALTGWNFFHADAWNRFWDRESKTWSPKKKEVDLTKLKQWDDPGYCFILRKPEKSWIMETEFDAKETTYRIMLSKRKENMNLAMFFFDVYESGLTASGEADRMMDYYKRSWKDIRGESVKRTDVKIGKYKGHELRFIGQSSSGSVLRQRNQYYKIGKLMYALGSWRRSGLPEKEEKELFTIFKTFRITL